MSGTMRWSRAVLPLALVLAAGCAHVPPPTVLAQADEAAASPAAREAKQYAPGAYEHAEKLRRDADAAFRAGDHAGAQILGERAIAAYAHAQTLARAARANEVEARAEVEVRAKSDELAKLEADQARVAAEVTALETKVKVTRDAQPIVPSGPADAAREKARFQAARAFALEAQLLCGGARMLVAAKKPADAPAKPDAPAPPKPDAPPKPNASPKPATPSAAKDAPGATASASDAKAPAAAAQPATGTAPAAPAGGELDQAEATLAKLLAALGPSAKAAPIDLATRSRAQCLAALTSVRRADTPVSRAPGAGDALLTELSAAGDAPSRDDRGVVVTLRDLFRGGALSPAGEAKLAELGRVAAAHPTFPVQVVVHLDRDGKKEDELAHGRADALVKALAAARAPHVESTVAGTAAPVVDPAGRDRARNARVEIVFVTPEAL